MFASLRKRMGLLLLAFLLLLLVSVTVTFWAIDNQKQDALIINLAGRQRMLIQQMTKEVLQLKEDREETSSYIPTLEEAAGIFDHTLRILSDGGQVPYPSNRLIEVPATQNPDILAGLQQVQNNWDDFRSYLNVIVTTKPGSPDFTMAAGAVERLSLELVRQTDEVVRLYEAASTRKVVRLWWIQGAFFVCALGLLVVGFWVIQKSVLGPLRRLGAAAERIGWGDLNTQVEVSGPREIEILSHSVETVRDQLQASQAELESRVTQRTRELTAMLEVSQEIVADLQLDHLLPSVTDRARALTQAQSAVLCLLERDGEYLSLAASSGQAVNPVRHRLVAPGNDAGQSLITEMVCMNCPFLKGYAAEQGIATPLRTGDQTLGALCVVRPGQAGFDPDETRALTLLANSTAIAIANARLVEAGQHQAEQAATLAERERLAAELHDHLAQTLSFLNLKTDRVIELLTAADIAAAKTELDRMKAAIGQIYGQVRAALVGLQEPILAADSSINSWQALAEKLTACLIDFQDNSGLPAELIIPDSAALALPRVTQAQALHIVREALTNVRRHAEAQRVWVRVEQIEEEARFTVEDDGCGFDPADIEGDNHLGLTIMRTRVERSGGRLIINSTPNTGTKVVACFPLVAQGAESKTESHLNLHERSSGLGSKSNLNGNSGERL